MRRSLFTLTFMWFVVSLAAQDPLPALLSDELARNMTGLAKEEVTPYFISYRVNETRSYYIQTSFGQVVSANPEPGRSRQLTVSVRVGKHERDNTHPLRSGGRFFFMEAKGAAMPIDSHPDGIRQVLWSETAKQFNEARDNFAKVQSELAIKVETEDQSDDFSREKPVTYYEEPLKEGQFTLNVSEWESRLSDYSAVFLKYKHVLKGTANITYSYERKYFVSSEGSSITENRITCRLFIRGETQADDGMVLPIHLSYFGFSPDDMPSHEQILSDVEEMAALLIQMRTAPVADSYAGPALLSAESAGVFFHEIFGHRIEGHRLKEEDDAQTFKKKVNEKVLHENLSVYFDPGKERYGNFFLNGSYKYDCEGQRGQRVDIVADGILFGFLMSRTPIEGFSHSNGHGRAQAGYQTVTRQSNLIVETDTPYTETQLREMLILEAKRQGKEYGYYFVQTIGGFTTTGRFMPNSFNVTPVVVYRIYVDGRDDELVRGVDLVGTPLAIFSNIEAAGDTPGVFTGTCGAESGGVPTSTISPMLFVTQIETQRKPKGQERLPILPRP